MKSWMEPASEFQSEYEREAYALEADRARREGRVPMPQPNVAGPGFARMADIRLPSKKGRK